jgi:hypothetical protein
MLGDIWRGNMLGYMLGEVLGYVLGDLCGDMLGSARQHTGWREWRSTRRRARPCAWGSAREVLGECLGEVRDEVIKS